MKYFISFSLMLAMAVTACTQQSGNLAKSKSDVQLIEDYLKGNNYEEYAVATVAGGCFWCTEAAFDRIQGVKDVISGYAGGHVKYPSYEAVCAKQTGHTESIQIFYDPEVVSYETLLEVLFVAHDPTTLNRQGNDVGPQYRSAIFYHDDSQKQTAEAVIDRLNKSGVFANPIVTEVNPYKEFWVAEGYHQNYYETTPGNPYIQHVSKPKVEKVKKVFADILKPKYRASK